jgi:hypothetical protein
MNKFKINYDDQPNDVVEKISSILGNFNLEITTLEDGDGFINYKICKKQWINDCIESYKPIFDKYTDLNRLPIYAWGRYYKYECAGGSFDSSYGDGFSSLESYDIDCDINWKLIEKIDEDKELWKTFGDEFYYPDRDICVEEYGGDDDRGGMCLVIERKDSYLIAECYNCDSPE